MVNAAASLALDIPLPVLEAYVDRIRMFRVALKARLTVERIGHAKGSGNPFS
jgi:hypothetical protein